MLLRDVALFLTNPAHGSASLAAVFLLGIAVGAFLNVCIDRLPLEKSLLWPLGSYCERCWQRLRWYDTIPIVSYLLLRGRCRVCQTRLPFRHVLVELSTALILSAVFYLEVIRNVHRFDSRPLGPEWFAYGRLALFGFHSVLVCLLLIATFSDLEHQAIPLGLTLFGTFLGLLGSAFMPWPWPYAAWQERQLGSFRMSTPESRWTSGVIRLHEGVYAWPVWGPLPMFLRPAGTWPEGLATGVAGAVVGLLLLRGLRFFYGLGNPQHMEDPDPELASAGLARRTLSWVQRVGGKALGVGDADLMMMGGAFLGWQPTFVALFLSIVPGFVHAAFAAVLRGNRPFAFGPSLACGLVVSFLAWPVLGPDLQWLLFNPAFMLGVAACWTVLPLVVLLLRSTRWLVRQLRRSVGY